MTLPIAAVLVAILVALLLLWYVLRLARRRALAEPAGADEASRRRSLANLRWSFRSAIAHIEANLASRWRRYRIPWVLLLGETGSGKTTLIESAGLDRAFKVSAGSVQHVGVGWNYFNRGVVLDVAGEYLGSGSGGSDNAWQALLYLAEKYRPQRPIDAVVVTVSAADLLAAQGASTEDLAQKGDLMHRRLWQAQSRFGVRFPVYVVITKCDRIPGFSSFVRALPAHMRDGMLGWSNPYDFETGYKSDWAQQGIDGVVQDVFAAQSELLADGRDPEDADGFVLFPSALSGTSAPLRVYLDQLFRPSAYHETFYFRGVYLTGDASEVARTESQAAAAVELASLPSTEPGDRVEPTLGSVGSVREPVFAHDLFERKVFPEFGLARASREALATRNRTVRILRWAAAAIALAWTVSLVWATFQLDSKIKAYTDALEVMVAADRTRTAAHARKDHLPIDWYLRNTNQLLDKIAPLGGVRLWWFSMPGSWPGLTSLHDEIQDVLYKGFQDIVFSSVRKGLNVKVSELTGLPVHEISLELLGDSPECVASRMSLAGQSPAPLAIEELPEFAALRERVHRMEALEANLRTFARLRVGEAEMRDLRALLRYTWRIELPETLDRGGYQEAALRQGYRFRERNPADIYDSMAVCGFDRGLDALYARFFANSRVLFLAEDIAARVSALAGESAAAEREEAPYTELVAQIDALDGVLKSPRGRWLATGERDLGPAFEDLMQHVSATAALGSRTGTEVRAKAAAEIESLRKGLAQSSAEAVGPIVRRTPEGAWTIAADLAAFQSSLATLFKQRFMADAEGRRLETRVDRGTIVRWDVKRLDEAIALADDQRRYLKDNLPKFPVMFHEEIREMADRRLAARMTDLVAKAESIVPEPPKARDGSPGTDPDGHELDRAGTQLVRLLTLLKETGASGTYDDLAGLLRRDAVRGLLAINRALDAAELYSVRDGSFSWWQGTKNPAVGAFRAADQQSLAELLAAQYAQVEWLSKLAAPLLAVVDSAGIRLDPEAARVVRRLRAIAREVERFKAKNPKSSVMDLENFVRTELAEVDGRNCIQKLAPRLGTAREGDFFLERELTLRQQLHARCVELAMTESSDAYAAIGQGFNRLLAGRFPFGRPEPSGTGEADPEDVVQFLRLYDRHVKAVAPLVAATTAPAGRAEAGRFLDQMARVRAFLAPLLPAEDGAPPAYEIGVEFRVNQAAEVDGNKIIDWILDVGDQSVRLRDAGRRVRWRPGVPIVLTLRWARDAPNAPVNDGSLPRLSIDGQNVSFRYADTWSLVSMLTQHAASPVDTVTRAETRPHTLKFEFVTQPLPGSGQYRSSLPEGRARVFLRLTVTPGGKKELLTLPMFPHQAPAFSSDAAYGTVRPESAPWAERPGPRAAERPGPRVVEWPRRHPWVQQEPAHVPPKTGARRTGAPRD